MWAWRRRNTAGSPMSSRGRCILVCSPPRPEERHRRVSKDVPVGVSRSRILECPSRPLRGASGRGQAGKRLDLIATRTSDPSARQEIILSIKHARPKADKLPERNYGRFCFAVSGRFTTTRPSRIAFGRNRHREERSDTAIQEAQSALSSPGLLRFARNDAAGSTQMQYALGRSGAATSSTICRSRPKGRR
jgi:hypothetical protein